MIENRKLFLGLIRIFWKDSIGDLHFLEQQEGIIVSLGDYVNEEKTVCNV